MDVSMEYNPYAAPTVEDPLQSQRAAGDGAPQPWEVGEVLGLGWEAVKRDWPVLVFAPFLAMVIASIPSVVLAMCVQAGVVELYSTEYFIAYAGVYIVSDSMQVFFLVGLLRIFCEAARGREPEFGTLFGGADRFLSLLGTTMLVGLAILGGLLLLIVPGVIMACGLWLAPYYCIDRGYGVFESMRASWRATHGQRGQMFLLSLASVGILLLGAVACCVGFFVAWPITYVASAIVYLRRTGQIAAAVPMGPGGFGPPVR
jgi:uncharacterized membrane protein